MQYKNQNVSGGKFIIQNGGNVRFIKMTKGQSTSKILNKIYYTWS